MKGIISFLFLFFSFYLQAQVLIHPDIEIDEFDWSAFSKIENIEKYIETREEDFELLGIGSFTTTGLRLDKSDLITLQQELYKKRTREKLTLDEITQAQDTIQFHLEKIKEKEDEIRVFVGFVPEGVPNPYSDEYEGVWSLYKDEYDIIFDLVEKTDEGFYEALGRDDEAYAEFILPYVRDYIERGEIIADTFTNVLNKAYENPEYHRNSYVSGLNWMSSRSREIYECFLKNFKSPEGENQVVLGELITNWYEDQNLMGVRGLIGKYELLNISPSLISGSPHVTVSSLVDYTDKNIPEKVKEELEVFFRRALTDERLEEGFTRNSVYLDSLIGLKYLNALTSEEEEAFKRAEELRAIRTSRKDPNFYFSAPSIDLK